MKKLLIIILVLFPNISFAENKDSILFSLKNFDYSKIDSVVVASNFEVTDFIKHASLYKTEKEKVRAVYVFVVSYMTYSNGEKIQYYESGVKFAIKYKTGVCHEYACLFKYLCNELGIECEKISGYSKSYNFINNISSLSAHVWNMVKIDGRNYLLDVTYEDAYNDNDIKGHWFLVKPEYFIETHYPDSDYYQIDYMTQTYVLYNGRKIPWTAWYLHKILKVYRANQEHANELSKKHSYAQCLNRPITLEYFICSKTKTLHLDVKGYRPITTLPANYKNLYL